MDKCQWRVEQEREGKRYNYLCDIHTFIGHTFKCWYCILHSGYTFIRRINPIIVRR